MALCGYRGMGWLRDLPDGRDFRPAHPSIKELFRDLQPSSPLRYQLPSSVDLREFFPCVDDQGPYPTSAAFAVLSLVGYFEGRMRGRTLDASRLFLHQMALKLSQRTGDAGTDLRTTLKALVRFGAPPENYWRYDAEHYGQHPTDAFLFSFRGDFDGIRYVRLDDWANGLETLHAMKTALALGAPVAFGFSVPSFVADDADVAYYPIYDSLRGGQAALAIGYDDRRRIGLDKGAILFRSSWGAVWGEQGYGWLSYEYVLNAMAVDFWTAMRPEWLESGALPQRWRSTVGH